MFIAAVVRMVVAVVGDDTITIKRASEPQGEGADGRCVITAVVEQKRVSRQAKEMELRYS